jgi:hypothetical protein
MHIADCAKACATAEALATRGQRVGARLPKLDEGAAGQTPKSRVSVTSIFVRAFPLPPVDEILLLSLLC